MVGIFILTNSSANSKKIKSFSHGEFNDGTLNIKNIEEKILENKDILDVILN